MRNLNYAIWNRERFITRIRQRVSCYSAINIDILLLGIKNILINWRITQISLSYAIFYVKMYFKRNLFGGEKVDDYLVPTLLNMMQEGIQTLDKVKNTSTPCFLMSVEKHHKNKTRHLSDVNNICITENSI